MDSQLILVSMIWWRATLASIDGLTFMNPVNLMRAQNHKRDGEDPCNPLYWYPRNIPDYCNVPTLEPTGPPTCPTQPPPPPEITTACPVPKLTTCRIPLPPMPTPVPLPAPIPVPAFPVPMQFYPPFPYPPAPLPEPIPCPPKGARSQIAIPMGRPLGGQMGMPIGGQMGMPMGGQLGDPMSGAMVMPMMQAAPSIMNYYRPPFGMIAGPLSKDGGINILPFSDVYSDAADRIKYKRIAKMYERRKHRRKKHKVVKFYDSDSKSDSS